MSEINLKIISAGAGSGKTYRLTKEMAENYIISKGVRISGILATTFTSKAAAELQERVRAKLLEMGKFQEANALSNALIGTVHGIGVKLLRRFAFEIGVSPEVDIISEEDQQLMFNNALATVLQDEHLSKMDKLVTKLGLNKKAGGSDYDWRRNVKEITEVARGNDLSVAVLEKSKVRSFESFKAFLGEKNEKTASDVFPQWIAMIEEAVQNIKDSGDETKTTADAISDLNAIKKEIKTQGSIPWHQWAKVSKIKIGAKSKKFIEEIIEFANQHDTFSDFHQDIQDFIESTFDIAILAINEYQNYKRLRGLIDYTDMEIMVKQLLDKEEVQEVLKDELDLLMVDEFQDTNPIQLAIFFKLSQLAKYSVWVGDPKQSIYGFRGADPKLMKAIVDAQGGVLKENILEHSYRSRRDIVYTTNAIFDKAFHDMETPQIVLDPQRKEHKKFGTALKHWHFQTPEGKVGDQVWFDLCIADAVKQYLYSGEMVEPKGIKQLAKVSAGDIAILCKKNKDCSDMAKALQQVGIKSAIAQNGLLATAEARLILACLKSILDANDALSFAEILVLTKQANTTEIIEKRLNYLENLGESYDDNTWADDDFFISKIKKLRREAAEFSSSEILNLLIVELDLRRIIMSWNNATQRIDNVDIVRKMALDYESACNRLNTASSLGGFILWLSDLQAQGKDKQASGEDKDAVNILTYHKSKGLEWPVVICHGLEDDLKDAIFGINIIPESDNVDLEDLLGGRWLRFWINPYANQWKKTALEERINSSDVKKMATQQALEEETRLMYVGITRARDYLIFPSRKGKETKWLNRTWHEGKNETPSLDAENQETQWEWKGDFLPIETATMSYDKIFEKADVANVDFDYFALRKGKNKQERYKIDTDSERFNDDFKISNIQFVNYQIPFDVAFETNFEGMKNTLQHYLLTNFLHADITKKTNTIEEIAKRMKWQAEDFSTYTKTYEAFYDLLEKNYDAVSFEKKKTLRYEVSDNKDKYFGRCFQTSLDFFAENTNEIVIVKNDFYNGEKTKSKINEQLAWAFWVKKSCLHFYPSKTIKILFHFPLQGTIGEVVW